MECQFIERILTELKLISEAPKFVPEMEPGAWPKIPTWISAGDDMSLIINQEISGLIRDLSDSLYAAKPSLSQVISRADWAGIVQRVLGPLLAATDLDRPFGESAKVILASLQKELTDTDWNYDKRTFLFGCSFMADHDIAPFQVGPVAIWPRLKWIEHAQSEGRISKTTHRRILAKWKGGVLRKRSVSPDSAAEDTIVRTIADSPFVCSVETKGLFGEVAKEKALVAARLALLGAALMWERASRALADFNLNYDGPPFLQNYAFYQKRPEIMWGGRWTNSIHGRPLFGELWEHQMSKRGEWWTVMGEALEFWLRTEEGVARPKLMKQFIHAFIWYYEACREALPMVATTKFVASMDSLTCGKQKQGIEKLISSRLGVRMDDPIRGGGLSFRKVVDELYSEGRSRLIHGTSDRLGHDWQRWRSQAESIARLCLILCMQWAAENPKIDNPRLMLKP